MHSEFFFINKKGKLIAVDPWWNETIIIDRVCFFKNEFYFFATKKCVFNERNYRNEDDV